MHSARKLPVFTMIYDNLRVLSPFDSTRTPRKLVDEHQSKVASKDAAIISPHGVELTLVQIRF